MNFQPPVFQRMVTVYGGQFGSEGKGQIARFVSEELSKSNRLIAYRIGGANAGHTFYVDGHKIVTCVVPGPMFLSPAVIGVIGPEGVISLDVLDQELQHLVDFHSTRFDQPARPLLLIDENAIVITKQHKEQEIKLVEGIASTGKGVGAATADKVMRNALAVDNDPAVRDFIDKWIGKVGIRIIDTILANMSDSWRTNANVIIEGTQGAGLSLHTGGFYPYCTSRECTPQGLWAGCGLHPAMAIHHESIMVIRTYPIRVGGPSGPLANEVSWEWLSEKLGRKVEEITTVTKNVRRVGAIDLPGLKRTVGYTRPDLIALTFLDYIDPEVYCKSPYDSAIVKSYIQTLEEALDVQVGLVSTGEGHVYRWR